MINWKWLKRRCGKHLENAPFPDNPNEAVTIERMEDPDPLVLVRILDSDGSVCYTTRMRESLYKDIKRVAKEEREAKESKTDISGV